MAIAGCAASVAFLGVAHAELEPGATPANPSGEVDLSRLLKLPDSYHRPKPAESRGGAGRTKWKERFGTVQNNLLEARGALDSAKNELAEVASDGGNYAMATPGTTTNPEDTPLSYKLRQEIRRQRELVARAEHKLRELGVEADIAGVPDEWRIPDKPDDQPN
jgi:hypothetical protein